MFALLLFFGDTADKRLHSQVGGVVGAGMGVGVNFLYKLFLPSTIYYYYYYYYGYFFCTTLFFIRNDLTALGRVVSF